MAEQLPRLCRQLLLPEGVPCGNPQQSEVLLKPLSPLFFCSTPFPSSCATMLVLAVVQFPSKDTQVLQPVTCEVIFWWNLPVLRQTVRVVRGILAIEARRRVRQVSMGFLLCTVVTLSEKEPEVQGNQTKRYQNIWTLRSSCENFYGILLSLFNSGLGLEAS